MAKRKKQTVHYTAIQAPRGEHVHVVSLIENSKTACGKRFSGRAWKLSLRRPTCQDCKLAVFKDCRRRSAG